MQRETYPLPRLAEHDFAALHDLMKVEADFPSTHSDWVALWARRSIEEQQRGYEIHWVDFRPTDLERFCSSTGLRPSWGALTKLVSGMAR